MSDTIFKSSLKRQNFYTNTIIVQSLSTTFYQILKHSIGYNTTTFKLKLHHQLLLTFSLVKPNSYCVTSVHCVTGLGVKKLIFGSGIKLKIETSKSRTLLCILLKSH